MASPYIVQPGNTVRDVCLNATGTMLSWDDIAEANGWTTWTPILNPGDQVVIPDSAQTDQNTLAQMKVYPASNTKTGNDLEILQAVFDLLTDRWILRTGFWDDTGVWDDSAVWID